MSTYYTCSIQLNAPFNQKTALMLIKKGKQLGFIYLDLKSYSSESIVANEMSPEQISHCLFAESTINEADNKYPKCLTVKYLETVFTLNFHEKYFNMELYFFALGSIWKKEINNEECFDFGRYVKLWIDMCEDFSIKKIETFTDFE